MEIKGKWGWDISLIRRRKFESKKTPDVHIHLNTIGKCKTYLHNVSIITIHRTSRVERGRRVQFRCT